MIDGLPDEDRFAAYELIAEVYDSGGYVRARDAAMDLLGRYVAPDGMRDIVEAGRFEREWHRVRAANAMMLENRAER